MVSWIQNLKKCLAKLKDWTVEKYMSAYSFVMQQHKAFFLRSSNIIGFWYIIQNKRKRKKNGGMMQSEKGKVISE